MRKIVFGLCTLLFSTVGYGQTNTFPSTGNTGIGTTSPQSLLHVAGTGVSKDAYSQYNGNLMIQASTGGRTTTTGSQLEFVIPANTDGTNLWGQGRIMTVAGNTNTSDATGKMIFGTRRSFNKLNTGTSWYYGDDITIDGYGRVGIGNITPGYNLDVAGTIRSTNSLTVFSNKFGQQIQFTDSTGTSAKWWMGLSDQYGTYFSIGVGTTNANNLVIMSATGNVLIGKTSQANTAYIFDVNGTARMNKVVINTTGADFVFEPGYHLTPLNTLAKFIQLNHYLPGIAPAKQMQKDGVDIGDNQTKLLQKIEELTLYVIEQDKKQQEQALQNEQENKIIAAQGKMLQQLQEQLTQLKEQLKK